MDQLTVAGAVQRDLDALAKRDAELARSTLAATALALAEAMDAPKVSATAKSYCATALQKVMEGLYEMAPDAEEDDEIDELKHRPDAGGTAASD